MNPSYSDLKVGDKVTLIRDIIVYPTPTEQVPIAKGTELVVAYAGVFKSVTYNGRTFALWQKDIE
jgi:hypothetical protein